MRCTFLPPHMLRALAESGDREQRDRAHAALELSAQFRGERSAAGPIAAFAAVPAGEKRRTIYDARNEHFSDVFGILVKQYALKHSAAKADWLVGEGLFTSRVNGVAVRSMKAPGTAYDDKLLGKDPQPAHMRDFKRIHDDNGGVHVNSGIPN